MQKATSFLLVLISSLVFVCKGQHVAILGGATKFVSNGKAGTKAPMINVSAEGVNPNFEIRLAPKFPISGGLEYFKIDLHRPDEQGLIPPGSGEGYVLVRTKGETRFIGGNVYAGGGTKDFRVFGFGTFGQLESEISTSYELHGWFKYQLPPTLTEKVSQFGYGGGGGLAFTKNHLWVEFRVGYLHPIKVVTPTVKLGVVF